MLTARGTRPASEEDIDRAALAGRLSGIVDVIRIMNLGLWLALVGREENDEARPVRSSLAWQISRERGGATKPSFRVGGRVDASKFSGKELSRLESAPSAPRGGPWGGPSVEYRHCSDRRTLCLRRHHQLRVVLGAVVAL